MSSAILQKNWIIIKNVPMKMHIGLFAFMFLFAYITRTVLGPMIGLNIYFLNLMIEIFKEDEQNESFRYIKGLPISNVKIVNSTYVSYLSLVFIGFVLSGVIGFIGMLFGIELEELYGLPIVGGILMVIYSSMIPICFRFKVKWALGIFMLYILIYAIIVAAILFGFGIFNGNYDVKSLYMIVGSSAIVMFILNYILSIVFVKNYK
ncbi:ABC-2 transporter permease [Peptoniphilus indolicus]|uniref:ABC-2 transporter permease n=2 Tax=Peptoniphilus indolicus TaxID=33030 RepID=G4D639_9FIRM|nr:ABC-2 transporter permease [Peptoniphilus indolicus]EGY77439.1 hypothetical protein HMPREF9129_1869 [Peptoniphilus indolicus ATCC 29427]SUB74531.1 Uncharacterised protein [Peptoniphilus indolicus]